MSLQDTHRYDDIIDLPRPVSRRHAPMSRAQRAAQFMPFAALAGYGGVIARVNHEHELRVAAGEGAFCIDSFGAEGIV